MLAYLGCNFTSAGGTKQKERLEGDKDRCGNGLQALLAWSTGSDHARHLLLLPCLSGCSPVISSFAMSFVMPSVVSRTVSFVCSYTRLSALSSAFSSACSLSTVCWL